MKTFLCELLFSCLLGAPGAKPVDELTYGTMLYSYYQQDYEQALLDTLVAEAQNRQGEDSIRFDLAKGSFAFSDGMYEFARETFDSVAPSELTDIDRMRLAFHLAREYYRRQEWTELQGQLEKIDLGKSWRGKRKHHPEVEYMRAGLAIENGLFTDAGAALAHLDEGDYLRAYGLFNLGVALREADDLPGAEHAFRELTRLDAQTVESRDLVERAKLALAFIARQQRQTADAESLLGMLPAQSRYRDIAMASYGSLAMETENYELAARIWLTLQNQEYWTSSTAQARLGFPVSLERFASREMALVQYQVAESSFENRLAALTTLNRQADDPAWVRGLLLVFSSPQKNRERMIGLMDRWQDQLGHTDWLEWLATEDTHEVLVEWRELLDMQRWLDGLPVRLGAYEEIALEQRRRASSARSLLHDQNLLAERENLKRSMNVQAQQVAQLRADTPERSDRWMLRLADGEERKLISRLSAMRELVARGMPAEDQKRWLERIARLEGVLFWQLVDESSGRIRNLEKTLQENVELLSRVDLRIQRVQISETQFAAGVETDFLAFSSRAADISVEVDTALSNREVALASQLKHGMQREMREVQQYLLVTRIAIARATDQLAMAEVRVVN
jgi:hypothetical protein